MSKVKRQHYVPKFYLRRFAEDDSQLFVFDKFTRTSFRSTITKVATERYFYDFLGESVGGKADQQLVESAFSSLEADFANTLDDLLASVDDTGGFRQEAKPTLAFLLKTQSFRTPEFRRTFIEMMETTAQHILDNMTGQHDSELGSSDEYRVRFNETTAPLVHAMLIFNPQLHKAFVATLLEHIWFVGLNQTAQAFYTSDNPVVRRPHRKDPFVSYAGFGSEGIEIAFPLTPKHVLVLCERTFFRQFADLDCSSLVLNAENVIYYNSLQVSQSYRRVYSIRNQFALAQMICDQNPEVCSPDRTRVEVN